MPGLLKTKALAGQKVRSGPGLWYPVLTIIYPQDRLAPVGTAADIQGFRKVTVQRNQVEGWVEMIWIEAASPIYVWDHHALVGLHGPADPGLWPWDHAAYDLIRNAKIEAVKLLAAADVDGRVVINLKGVGVKFIMARLFAKFDHELRTPRDFVEEILPSALKLYYQGVEYFEVHNEPNLTTEGWMISWASGAGFARFFLDTVELLKKHMPKAKFGFPGLSPGGPFQGLRMDEHKFWAEAEQAIKAADWLGCHVYWDGISSGWLEASWDVQNFASKHLDKLVMVTEFSNPSAQQNSIKGNDYVKFFKAGKATTSNVGALFSYVLSASYTPFNDIWKGTVIPSIVGQRDF